MIYLVMVFLSFIFAYTTGIYIKKVELKAHSCELTKAHHTAVLWSSWVTYSMLMSFSYYSFGMCHLLLLVPVLAFMAMVSAYEDIKYQEIQDGASIIGLIWGILLMIYQRGSMLHSVYGLLIGGGVLLLIALLTKGEGMGGADIKLMAAYGLLLQYKLAVFALLVSFVLGSIIGIFLLVSGRKQRNDAIAFSPYLSLGALIAVFCGDAIIRLYFNGINIY